MLSLALWPSCYYSDPYTYGATGNAASSSLSWGMAGVLPDAVGLDINGLLYRYTTVKNTEDAMKVHVGNLNSTGDGYVFRETDNWSGVPKGTMHARVQTWMNELRLNLIKKGQKCCRGCGRDTQNKEPYKLGVSKHFEHMISYIRH